MTHDPHVGFVHIRSCLQQQLSTLSAASATSFKKGCVSILHMQYTNNGDNDQMIHTSTFKRITQRNN